MPTRKEIHDTLIEAQEKHFAFFRDLSPEDREKPCTPNGLADEAPWSAKDHLAHLAANEHGILELLRHVLSGATGLPGNLASMSQEQLVEWSQRRNQSYVEAHRDDELETLFATAREARQQTLALLEQMTDEQLATPASMFGADRTIGEIFVLNTLHDAQHIAWVEEGFRQGL